MQRQTTQRIMLLSRVYDADMERAEMDHSPCGALRHVSQEELTMERRGSGSAKGFPRLEGSALLF